MSYPTQKPLALLERIIQASSNEGEVVLDPFCGCGAAVIAAQKLNRRWLGTDTTHLATNLIRHRLRDAFELEPGEDYAVVGEPVDLSGAENLAKRDRYQFQWWALSLIDALPYKDKKKGKDTGIDGWLYYYEDQKVVKKAVVQVKSGEVSSGHIRDLKGVMEREGCNFGIYLTLEKPTRDMEKEAAAAGFYDSKTWGRAYLRLQTLTVEELLQGRGPKLPPIAEYRKRARRETKKSPKLL